MNQRRGFTLVELLVSIALTLFILTILGQAFVLGTDTFRTLKAVGDLNGTLRTAANILRADLVADHFEGKRRLSDERFVRYAPGAGAPPNNEPENKYDGPPQQGYFFLWTPAQLQPPGDLNEGPDADGIESRKRISHILAFTVKLRGNRPQNYFSAVVPPLIQGGDGRFEQLNSFNSQWAEIAYFVRPLETTPGAPLLFALYRQQRLVVADVDALNWQLPTGDARKPVNQLPTYKNLISCMANPNAPTFSSFIYFNSPSDLTIPERRTAGNFKNLYQQVPPYPSSFIDSFKPLTNPPDSAIASNRTGADLLLTDVLSFDVKVMRGRVPRVPDGLPGIPPFMGEFEDLPAPNYFDTWTRRVDDVYFEYGDAALKPIPNSSYRIMALHITLRVWDAKTQLTRQITVIQDM